MNDMRPTVIPKSDQINADTLIGGPMTIKITKVHLSATAEQPVDIYFEGDDGKPYRPCKTCRRILVNIWGPDASKYIGRSMTLFRDEKVKFGGLEVGGIRISHMSDISEPVTMALTASRANRKPFTVKPLRVTTERATQAKTESGPQEDVSDEIAASDALKSAIELWADDQENAIRPETDPAKVHAWVNSILRTAEWGILKDENEARAKRIREWATRRIAELKELSADETE